MIEYLSLWIKFLRGYERVWVLGLSVFLLCYFLEQLCVSVLVFFYNLGFFVGFFFLWCVDLWFVICQEVVDCVYFLFYFQFGYEGFFWDYCDDVVEWFFSFKDGFVYFDFIIFFYICYSIGQIIVKCFLFDQFISFLLIMFEVLGDFEKNCF